MNNKKISVAGASPDMWQEIGAKLGEHGYIVSYHDFADLKNYLKHNQPDMLVLDIVFPFQKGADILRELKNHPTGHRPIVFGICEFKALKDNHEHFMQINSIYPISKIFPKPLKINDIADETHREFFPSSKSLKLILVIDDSPTQLGITIKTLSPRYNVVTASTGHEGLRLAMSEDPDLILLDLNMPDINGLKVCADLKSFHPTDRTPILVYSWTSDQHQIHKAFLVGATDYITKSSSEDELIKKIDNFLKSNYILPQKTN